MFDFSRASRYTNPNTDVQVRRDPVSHTAPARAAYRPPAAPDQRRWRALVLLCLAEFMVASAGAGLAADGSALVAARALQGVGAALLSPAALSIITTTFHGPERRRALGVWAGIGGTGAAVGVLLGGLVASTPGWEWIFFVNVPVGLLVAVGVPLLLATRPVAAGYGVMLAASGLLISGFFLNSLLLQRIMGLSALRTALVFPPVALATIVGAQ